MLSLLFPGWTLLAKIAAPLIVVGVVAGGIWGYGHSRYKAGERETEAKYQAAELEFIQKARQQEQEWNRKIQEVRDAEAAEKTRIAAVLSDALIRLRNRPQRMPPASRPACQGATGAELSDVDGTFLVRESARADRLRADLKTCQEWIDAVTEVEPKASPVSPQVERSESK